MWRRLFEKLLDTIQSLVLVCLLTEHVFQLVAIVDHHNTGLAHVGYGPENAFGGITATGGEINDDLPIMAIPAQLAGCFADGVFGGEAADDDGLGLMGKQPFNQAAAAALSGIMETGAEVFAAFGFDFVVVIGGAGQAGEEVQPLALLRLVQQARALVENKILALARVGEAAEAGAQSVLRGRDIFNQQAQIRIPGLTIKLVDNLLGAVHMHFVVGGMTGETALRLQINGDGGHFVIP